MKWFGFVCLGLLASASGCDEPPPPAEKKAPWLAHEGDRPGPSAPALPARFEFTEGQVSFRLPARDASPSGRVHAVRGSVVTNLTNLVETSGRFEFDLESLAIDADGGGRDAERTREALAWLGLGAEVSPAEREKSRIAIFEITSLDAPSSVFAHRGVPSKSEENVRSVTATLHGRLVVRRLSVDHRFPIILDFLYAGPIRQESMPVGVRARLPKNERVPLAEHDIAPRDVRGHTLPELRALLGKTVGSSVLVDATFSGRTTPALDPAPSSP